MSENENVQTNESDADMEMSVNTKMGEINLPVARDGRIREVLNLRMYQTYSEVIRLFTATSAVNGEVIETLKTRLSSGMSTAASRAKRRKPDANFKIETFVTVARNSDIMVGAIITRMQDTASDEPKYDDEL